MKHLYKLSIFFLLSSALFVVGATFTLAKTQTPGYWEWGLYASALLILASGLFIINFRQQSSESLKLQYQQALIDEQRRDLEHKQNAYQESLSLLENKEKALKQQLLQYQQYVEFPPQKAETIESADEYFDEEIAEILHNQAKLIFDKIIHKKYMENESINHALILKDIVDLIEAVARVHHPDSKNPILETSIENLFRALNRMSLQLLVLVDSFPVNIKDYNLRKTYLYIQKSSTAFGYYKKAEPFLSFATPMFRAGLVIANPVLGIAQTAAIEAGKHVIKKSSEKYALSLLHDVIAIIGEQATTIFGDSALRYRSKHWIYALELTDIVVQFNPVTADTLAKAMQRLSGLTLRSEYDRIFLYHCMAQGQSAHPESYANDFISAADKQGIAAELSEFVERYIDKTPVNLKRINTWRKHLEQRLALDIPLKQDKNDRESLKNRLSAGSPEKSLKPFLARSILASMQSEEVPQFIYTDIVIEKEFSLLHYKSLWLVISNQRLRLLAVDKQQQVKFLWQYQLGSTELSIQRIKRVVADDCQIIGGQWDASLETEYPAEFMLQGRKVSSYESYFRALEECRYSY
ncbi:MAG: hypothetical protein GQ582_03625, partial [Methyloprofundus sp.]|nr:hypothetical protein [Methyloprofundus sp.]